MRTVHALIHVVFTFTWWLCGDTSALSVDEKTTVFVFGSCNKPDLPQPLWGPVVSLRPQVFIWLGDAVYADYKQWKRFKSFWTWVGKGTSEFQRSIPSVFNL